MRVGSRCVQAWHRLHRGGGDPPVKRAPGSGRSSWRGAAFRLTGSPGGGMLWAMAFARFWTRCTAKREKTTMAEMLRAGMIGLDTSHCGAFAKIFKENPDWGVKVAVAYPSYSPDLESSASRIEQYKKAMTEEHGVKLTESIDELLEQSDVVMIESVDGRRHLKELRAVAPSGKPTFIDKPFAASWRRQGDGQVIKAAHLPCFSGRAAVRLGLRDAWREGQEVRQIIAWTPTAGSPDRTNLGLFWYGIHGVRFSTR